MILAFMGNDGSGKSTTAREVTKKLEERGYRVIYRAGFDHFLLGYFIKLIKKLIGSKAEVVRGEFLGHDAKKRSMVSYLWPYLVWVDSLCKYIWASTKSDIVLFDRCWYDFLISYENLGYSNSFLRRLFLILPRPHLVFIMDAPAQVMYERKKHDHASRLEYYQIQRKRYLDLAKKKNFPVISTDVSLEESVRKVIEVIEEI